MSDDKIAKINTLTAGLAAQLRAERRERIATAALQGILTNPAAGGCGPVEEIAHYAVRYADALIAELDKEPQP